MAEFPSHAKLANLGLMEELYQQFLQDPSKLESSWRHFFEGIEFASYLVQKGEAPAPELSSCRIFHLIQSYRRHGHLLAKVNPIVTEVPVVEELTLRGLGFLESEKTTVFPTLGFCSKSEAPLEEIIAALHAIYCTRIGFEYMDLGNPSVEKWLQERIEPTLSILFSLEEKKRILEHLDRSESFETFLHTKYQGQTRFSLEGNETLIPLLIEMISFGADRGFEMFVMGMAHRGRLNVLTNVLQKPEEVLFKEFEDTIPYLGGESGDVKYHKGFSSDVKTAGGKTVHLHLSANSSCLESIDGIVLGETRAKQSLIGDTKRKRVMAILMHGDAALAGQGVVYETLQMGRVEGFSTGGAIHIAVNNQIGYTTLPKEGRSTRYCTDIAKTFGAPVFHVNAEDPEAAVFAARLAIELKLAFECDVFIDLNGYRKYGHNEGDEPGYTQPKEYALIRSKQSIRKQFIQRLLDENVLTQEEIALLGASFKERLQAGFAKGKVQEPLDPKLGVGKGWESFVQPPAEELFKPVSTQISLQRAKGIVEGYATIPEGFTLHPKLVKWVEEKKGQLAKDPMSPSIDWGTAELLAMGSLLLDDRIPLRLAGEDSIRGTFSHRHAGWFDQNTGKLYMPLAHLEQGQPSFEVYNTILSEYGALSYEFGYSWAHPEALVLWEAQYGDFVIGAQIPIDHYLVAGEHRWNRYSSLVLLLPHDYVGGGPEHSSARIERFLQLTANHNVQIVYPSTPAQLFHLLKRQGKQKIKKPLIVFIPKSLLRFVGSFSPLHSFLEGGFEEFLDDPTPPEKRTTLVVCTGKFYYDLLKEREKFSQTVLVRMEQLYPIHEEKWNKLFEKHSSCRRVIWAQEEPENMGAWEFLRPFFQKILPKEVELLYVGRERSSSPATGSRKKHIEEQQSIIERIINAIRN